MGEWEPMLEQMLASRYRALTGYALMLCGNRAEADDLVQDAIVATFGSLRRFESAGQAEAYVRRAIASRFIDAKRRDQSKRRAMRVLAHDDTSPAAGPALLAEHSTDVARALATLPPRQRACVVLRYLDHLSTREVAHTLNIAEGSVKRYTADAVARLAPLLGIPAEDSAAEWHDMKVTP